MLAPARHRPLLNLTQEVSGRCANAWAASAIAPGGQVLANFGDGPSSWSIAYNLFADHLLQTDIVDQRVSACAVPILVAMKLTLQQVIDAQAATLLTTLKNMRACLKNVVRVCII